VQRRVGKVPAAGTEKLPALPPAAFRLQPATIHDADEIAELRNQVAEHLTEAHGRGHWSGQVSGKAVLLRMRAATVFAYRMGARVVATLSLGPTKPWAIDPTHFTRVRSPLYLTDMAVAPEVQRRGVGRACLQDVRRIAHAWPADAIRLDAYDAPAGAGGFYERCGYREVERVVYRKVPLIYFESLL
jgi:GNAT superfamily N-acetyltransferase